MLCTTWLTVISILSKQVSHGQTSFSNAPAIFKRKQETTFEQGKKNSRHRKIESSPMEISVTRFKYSKTLNLLSDWNSLWKIIQVNLWRPMREGEGNGGKGGGENEPLFLLAKYQQEKKKKSGLILLWGLLHLSFTFFFSLNSINSG